MGNTGSAHNLYVEDVSSELNSYYQQQQRQRASRRQQPQKSAHPHQLHWTRSLPHMSGAALDATTTNENTPVALLQQIKVLPQLNERLKLRTTTNGAILHSGGTISGRREPQQVTVDVSPAGRLMMPQRSRTFIDDPRQLHAPQEEADRCPPTPPFRRARTMLQFDYESRRQDQQPRRGSVEAGGTRRIESKGEDSLSGGPMKLNGGAKANKYNKKRKAPAVPEMKTERGTLRGRTVTTAASASVTLSDVKAKREGERERERETLTKVRLFRSNAMKPNNGGVMQKQQQQQEQLQPSSCFAKFPPSKPNQVKSTASAVPVFRREKTSDAILLRQRSGVDEPTAPNKPLMRTLSSRGGDKSKAPLLRPISIASTQVVKETAHKESKTPQLNRATYFGMSTANGTPRPKVHKLEDNPSAQAPVTITTTTSQISIAAIAAEQAASAAAADAISHYKLSISPGAKAIVDNGLLVNVRPTLPRRQLNTPSFSPASAWRMLVEDQQKLQMQRKASEQQVATTANEAPIQRHHKEARPAPASQQQQQGNKVSVTVGVTTWTPQQDLGEDDDLDEDPDEGRGVKSSLQREAERESKKCECPKEEGGKLSQALANVHVFSLSLPRETHLQAQIKSRLLAPLDNAHKEEQRGFSSLQKLKYSGNSRAIHDNNNNNNTQNYVSDNWVLHKTKSASSLTATAAAATTTTTITKRSSHFQVMADHSVLQWESTIEPHSLSYLTGGKHVIYLPTEPNNGTQQGVTAAMSKRSGKSSDARQQIKQQMDVLGRSGSRGEPAISAQLKQEKRLRRMRPARESLQDAITVEESLSLRKGPSAGVVNSPDLIGSADKGQRFSFQSTVRLLEKRRLAEKLAKDAEIREAQRKSELEVMKRVEEDFQRKRAVEKANLCNQLRLYFNETDEQKNNQQQSSYLSLPLYGDKDESAATPQDKNNNAIITNYRADPDGAVSTPSPGPADVACGDLPPLHASAYDALPQRYDSDCGESDLELEMATNFTRTASLLGPYLQSITN